ncbi:MAG TPA: CpsD/CapB family tyrosine-protein kinase [Arsenicitalea sp.]|jgi:Mrp family chromosome partitioning ATPase|nr:CpsD/CapB family tyrosine-protein kinase [Arsenicitalea sp.]
MNVIDASSRPPLDDPWLAMPVLNADHRRLARSRIITLERSDPAHVAFDMLRTKISKTMRQNNWTTLAVTSPTSGCGKTTMALNLAFSFAKHKDLRTVLVDLDLRRPEVAHILGLKPKYSTERFLKGEAPVGHYFVRHGENLAIGASSEPVVHAAELLQDRRTSETLDGLRQLLRPDLVIFDLPPMLVNDDLMGFLSNIDCVMLVAAADASTIAEVDVCERELAEDSKLLGVVLNKCRYQPDDYYYY